MSTLIAVTALGSVIMGGVFFAFSSFVMGALGRLPPAQGIAAMQSMNIVVINPAFMTVFLGTGAASVAVAVTALSLPDPARAYLLGGALAYLAGVIGVTMAFNVPLNNAVDAADPASGEAARFWSHYSRQWTAWNHVRTIAGIAAGALMAMALFAG
jgi:uncharacterized membrane protein